jgi:hypothetical protein
MIEETMFRHMGEGSSKSKRPISGMVKSVQKGLTPIIVT